MYVNPLIEALGLEQSDEFSDAESIKNNEQDAKNEDSCAAPEKKPGLREKPKQGRVLELPEIVPADEMQDGAQLLDDIARQFRRFVVVDDASITAMSLWVVFSHLAKDAACCPNIVFTSAVKACGKSTALEVIGRLVPKHLATANVTPAALFRTIEMLSPTLLIDEADSMFRNNDDLRTIINAGFTRTAATVIRIVGDDLEPRIFSVYCPKAIALIGALPDTIESRSIVIRMRRRLSTEHTERLRSDKDQEFSTLASRIARWVSDKKALILKDEPEVPEPLPDRQADVWRELLRVADVAGGEWPKRARDAALEFCSKVDEGTDIAIRLLSDIEKIFNSNPGRIKWPSQTLVDALNGIEESPWQDFANGKRLTANRLARMLARFDIHPETLKEEGKTFKGYLTDSFTDALNRNLPKSRNTAMFDDNALQGNSSKCDRSVFVADANRNISEKTGQQEGGR